MAPTYLDAIIEHHRRRASVDERSWRARLDDLEVDADTPRSFARALEPKSDRRVAVIAEVKRRSPSKGWLAEHLDVEELARDYEAGGASAISVLTDDEYFSGTLEDLSDVRRVVDLPLLRKDFTLCENDVIDAFEAGASACLLIVAALEDAELTSFVGVADHCGIDALVEVHDERELSRAIDVGARIIGVNQRDLRSFEVDAGRAASLVGRLPSECLSVCESGLSSVDDVRAAALAGFDAVLVGEAFVRSADPKGSVASFSTVERAP